MKVGRWSGRVGEEEDGVMGKGAAGAAAMARWLRKLFGTSTLARGASLVVSSPAHDPQTATL